MRNGLGTCARAYISQIMVTVLLTASPASAGISLPMTRAAAERFFHELQAHPYHRYVAEATLMAINNDGAADDDTIEVDSHLWVWTNRDLVAWRNWRQASPHLPVRLAGAIFLVRRHVEVGFAPGLGFYQRPAITMAGRYLLWGSR